MSYARSGAMHTIEIAILRSMLDYLFSSRPMYLWLAVVLPVFSAIYLMNQIDDFSSHFSSVDIAGRGVTVIVDPNGL